ncbi:DUF502 domain-containing protein [Alicyclobacillaceae bacterium I2511]|nr:DUF502 domain-containing protein [Alicyclobacillaceae bacterium I2511]
MISRIAKYFGVGLATILPFALVIWVVVSVVEWVDGWFGNLMESWLGITVPGLGFVMVMLGITALGILTRTYISRRIITWLDLMFSHIPLVRSLYTLVKEIVNNVLGHHRGFQRVVLVPWPDEHSLALGFLTQEMLPTSLDPDGDRVAVFLPFAFQFAGVTVMVERRRIQPCNLSVEEGLKFVLSAGLGQSNGVEHPSVSQQPPVPPFPAQSRRDGL